MSTEKKRRDKVISAVLTVACVLAFGVGVFYAIAEGLRADATGTGANSLPAFVSGFVGIALLIAAVWYFVRTGAGTRNEAG